MIPLLELVQTDSAQDGRLGIVRGPPESAPPAGGAAPSVPIRRGRLPAVPHELRKDTQMPRILKRQKAPQVGKGALPFPGPG
jgi:hypothetical protein